MPCDGNEQVRRETSPSGKADRKPEGAAHREEKGKYPPAAAGLAAGEALRAAPATIFHTPAPSHRSLNAQALPQTTNSEAQARGDVVGRSESGPAVERRSGGPERRVEDIFRASSRGFIRRGAAWAERRTVTGKPGPGRNNEEVGCAGEGGEPGLRFEEVPSQVRPGSPGALSATRQREEMQGGGFAQLANRMQNQ